MKLSIALVLACLTGWTWGRADNAAAPVELALYYDFDGLTNGLVLDQSGHARHGAAAGAALAPGVRGGALVFNGSNVVECGEVPLAPAGAIMFWLNPAPGEQGGEIVTIRDGFKATQRRCTIGFRGDTSRKLFVNLSDGKNARMLYFGNYPPEVWQHIAVVYGDGQLRLYENGIPLGAAPMGFAPETGGLPLRLGDKDWGGKIRGGAHGRHYAGKLDELRIYNRALAGDEIRALFWRDAPVAAAGAQAAAPRMPAERAPSNFYARITAPAYRNCIYHSQKLAMLKYQVYFSPDPAGTNFLTASLLRGEEIIRADTHANLASGAELSMPADDLAEGVYRLALEFSQGGRQQAWSAQLRKLPRHPGEVRVDEHRRVLVDGAPFVPAGWFWTGLTAPFPVERFKNINTVYNGAWFQSLPALTSFLDACARSNLKAVISPYQLDTQRRYSRTLIRRGDWKTFPDEELAKVRRVAEAVQAHPALLGWYLADEPDSGDGVAPAVLRRVYDALREADPYHPCLIVNTHAERVADYLDCADIMLPDKYLNFQSDGIPIMPLDNIVEIIRPALGRKPVWLIPQAWNWGEMLGSQGQPKSRGPNYVELRNNVFMAVAAGASGIIWYPARQAFDVPAVRHGYAHLALELTTLARAVQAPEMAGGVEYWPAGAPLTVSLREDNGHLYIFAVNRGAQHQDVIFRFKEIDRARLLVVSEGRVASINDRVMRAHFAPYAARVYTTDFNPRLLDLLTIAEIEALAAAAGRASLQRGSLLPGMPGLSLDASFLHEPASYQGQYKSDLLLPDAFRELLLQRLVDGRMDELARHVCVLGPGQWLRLAWPVPIQADTIRFVTASAAPMRAGEIAVLRGDHWEPAAVIKQNHDAQVDVQVDGGPVRGMMIEVSPSAAGPVVLLEAEALADAAQRQPADH